MNRILVFLTLFAPAAAVAHHLDAYDRKIRKAANLPAVWFKCKIDKDCDLVSVPCKSDIAVNGAHKDEARQALIDHYYFCLGESIHDSEASCEEGQCMTNPKDLPNNGN